MRGLSLVVASGGHSSSRCAGLSLSRPLLLRSTGSRRAGSVVVAHRAQLLRGMWDLPRPGHEPVSPALAGGFLTTAPPGKPHTSLLKALSASFLASLQPILNTAARMTLSLQWLPVSLQVRPKALGTLAFSSSLLLLLTSLTSNTTIHPSPGHSCSLPVSQPLRYSP